MHRQLTMLILTWLLPTMATSQEVARVGGRAITVAQFRSALETLGPQAELVRDNPDLRRKFLDHMIDADLMAAKAVKAGLDQDPRLQAQLAASRRDLLANAYLEQQTTVLLDKANLEAYFIANAAQFSDKEVRASHILINPSNGELARKILVRALAKEDFAKLAASYSSCPTKKEGGDLSFIKKGQLVPEVEQVAFSTAKDQIHPQLVKSRFGWHIVKVTDIIQDNIPTFAAKADEVRKLRSREAKLDLVTKLRREAGVSIHDSVLLRLNL
jgi:peptidyl-prolyl cis-trans isomerase C